MPRGDGEADPLWHWASQRHCRTVLISQRKALNVLKALQHPMAFVLKIWQVFKPNLKKFLGKKKSEDRLCTSGVVHVAVLTSCYFCGTAKAPGVWSRAILF